MKLFYKTISVVLLLGGIFISDTLFSQDPQFGQFYAAPLQTNPAMTGVHTGRYRIALNYRDQWNSVVDEPFRTFAASFDIRYRIGKGDFLAFGANALHDRAGASPYQRTQGYLNASYMKQLSGSRYRTSDQFLIGGLQVGFGQHALDFSKLWFSSQFNPGTVSVDFGAPTGEQFGSSSQVTSDMYMDFNAGILYYALLDDDASFYIGGSAHHLNGPQISFLDNSSQSLYMKLVAQVGGQLPFTDELSLLPAAMVAIQGPSLTTILGGNFRYSNSDWRELAIRAGVWAQISKQEDANGADIGLPSVIISTILEMERINIGISYDINAGYLNRPTDGRGAIELSLIYVHPAERHERVNCPKF
ncbi:MAG: PorP/SprF family type IX secretion system membrane protein [Saprospirales bacterium]|nr:PorP/SprF family type IX secretion system membrane protein [Saprospirales bacterium]MBK8490989.1 PorP/SprF family type IX secretion system membrane protein [Saprospirales bacterium]